MTSYKKIGNAVAKDLRTPKYKMRVERNRKAYNRKSKHRLQEV
jgi:stalled ribosome alternative rescue factor ArfA